MSRCCAETGCSEFFGERFARRSVKRYRKRGLDKLTRSIFDVVTERGVQDRSVLEIGGGVGALDLELVRAGAARAVNVEVSPAYGRFARELAREARLDDRVEHRVDNVAENGRDVGPADVVVLNRVVCCYPDDERLVAAAAERTRRLLVLTYPSRRLLTRLFVTVQNAAFRLLGRSFRTYIHDPAAIHAAAEARGLSLVLERPGFVWRLAALERAA